LNLRYEGTVHHRSYRPQSLLDSTIHSCNQSVIIDATTLPTEYESNQLSDDIADSEMLFVTDFVNLKIKPTQSFRDDHRCKMCIMYS
jgi:hypothetical protein